MASVSAFNDMMGQFIAELHKAFPKESGIKKFMTSFELLRDANPRKCVEVFMGGIGKYATKISDKDETFITEDIPSIDFIKDLNIQDLWASASPKTRDAIWQYLQNLYMIGTLINIVPESTLNIIGNIAKDAADKIQSGEIDEAALQKMIGGFGGLLGGMTKK